MVDVNVTISGIIMCCDESVCNVNLGRGYTIEKCPLDELPFKNAIMDGRNNLSIDYLTSRIIEDGKIYFICLKKMDTIQIEEPHPHLSADGTYRMSNIDCMCEDQLKPYMDGETQYLNEQSICFGFLRQEILDLGISSLTINLRSEGSFPIV